MRYLVLLLVWFSVARADTRFDVHVGGGLEGGMIQGKARPDAVAELGAGVGYLVPGKTWGFGVAVERVERPSASVPIGSELKLDVLLLLANTKQTFVGGVGMGVRRLAVEGGTNRPGSAVWGIDLMRLGWDIRIARRGNVGLDFYFTWTFGLYSGEIYMERFGDMAFPKQDFSTLSTAYVLGLQATLD